MGQHRDSILTATAAAKILCKMLDFQKNRHADSVVRELCEVDTEFIAFFELEDLLENECKSAILLIYKTYIEKHL